MTTAANKNSKTHDLTCIAYAIACSALTLSSALYNKLSLNLYLLDLCQSDQTFPSRLCNTTYPEAMEPFLHAKAWGAY